jgi:two-component system response regulator NreC
MTRAERADRDKTTIVIADDHTVVRQGLRMLIDADPALQVVAEAGTLSDAERLTRAHRPSVFVLDVNMHGESGLEAIPRLRADQQLFLSTRTVETHRAHIRQKIRGTSRAELVRYALDHGLVEV